LSSTGTTAAAAARRTGSPFNSDTVAALAAADAADPESRSHALSVAQMIARHDATTRWTQSMCSTFPGEVR
jgi:hypothetical protein